MTLNDLAHTPDHLPRPHGRAAAEATADILANKADGNILVAATRPTATGAMIRTALGTLATNWHDVPCDLRQRLLAHYCPQLAATARSGLFNVLCALVDDLYALSSGDAGALDKWREEGKTRPDVHALIDICQQGVDDTLHMLMLAPTTPGRAA